MGGNVFGNCAFTTAGPIGNGYDYEFSWKEAIPAHSFMSSNLSEVVIPEGVTSIGDFAFAYCDALFRINIPESVTRIGEEAFWYCRGLTNITIPASVIEIEMDAFGCCAYRTTGPIGGGYDYEFGWENVIPAYAFCDGTSLSSVIIPEGITKIGKSAFAGTQLTKIDLPDGLTEIEGYLFSDSTLKSIIIPDGVTTIGTSAFARCQALTEVELPETLIEIGEEAFYYCTSLRSIIIPVSVTTIGNCTFGCCSFMTAGPIGGDYNYQFAWTEEIPVNAFKGLEYLEKVYSPKSITYSEGDYFDVPVTVCGTRGSSAEAYVNAHSDTYTFEAVDEFDVQFETYTEEKVKAQSRFIGIRVIEPKNLEKEGYTLKGWYTSAEIMDDTTKWDFANDVVTQNMTLYAKWISDTDKISEELKGYSLSLEGTIGVNFYMQLGEDVLADAKNGAYMNFTLERKDGKEYIPVPVNKAVYDEEKACYVFKCGVPVKDMDIQIKGQIILSDGREGDVYSCTVREYIEDIKTDEKYKDQQKLFTLVENMSNFGDYATAYFANKTIGAAPELTETELKELANYKANISENDFYYGSSLLLKSDTVLRHYFTKKVTVAESGYKVGEKGGFYYIESEGIHAHELGILKTVHVTTTDDNKDMVITYNPLSYAHIVLNRGGDADNLTSLMRVMYRYYQAALDYKAEVAK